MSCNSGGGAGGGGGGLGVPPTLLPSSTTPTSTTNTTDKTSDNPRSTSQSNGGDSTSVNGNGNNGGSGGSGESQHFCLRWNNHLSNLMGTLSTVMASEQYADVTIFCEGTILRVHKLVLLASSVHFERILQNLPDNQHPFIVLDGTRLTDIQSLVEYMYKGEVNIAQDNLKSLLKTAETLQIKGLIDIEHDENPNKRRPEPQNCRPSDHDRNGDRDPDSHVNPLSRHLASSTSPPHKRSRISPIDTALLRERIGDALPRGEDSHMGSHPDVRDLRLESRQEMLLHRDSSRGDYARDLSRDRDGRDHSFSRDTPNRDLKLPRDLNRELLQREQLSREVPRDLSSHTFSGWPSSSSSRRLTPSPVITAPSPIGRSLPTSSAYYSRAGQFDAPLLPPRSSPKSPVHDNKLPSQLGISPFGLPFNLPNLPLLQDKTKNILERSNHLLLPNTRYETEERDMRDKERLGSTSWPSRSSEEFDRDLENGRDRDRNIERDRDSAERYTILHKTLLQHKQNQQREQRERDLQQQQQSSALLSFQLSQQQQQQQLQQHPQQPQPQPQQSSSQYPPQISPLFPSSEVVDSKDSKDIKDVKDVKKDIADHDRSNDDDKTSISPAHDKSQFSPPSDDSGGSAKHESDGLVMDEEEEEEDSRSSTGGSNGSRAGADAATDLSTAGPGGKLIKKIIKGTGSSEERVKCPYCTRAYRHQNNLRTHIRCFHKGVRIPCPICQRGFTRWFTVRCHIAREHQNVDMSRPDTMPTQVRRAFYNNQYNDPARPTIGSYQDELRLSNTAAALTNYSESGAPPSVLPTQP